MPEVTPCLLQMHVCLSVRADKSTQNVSTVSALPGQLDIPLI